MVLLGLMLLLAASPSMAADPYSEATGVGSPIATVALDHDHPGSHCHHGHGFGHSLGALPRLERQVIELDSSLSLVTTADRPPHRVAVSGMPSPTPDPSPVPVYLLTERFRS